MVHGQRKKDDPNKQPIMTAINILQINLHRATAAAVEQWSPRAEDKRSKKRFVYIERTEYQDISSQGEIRSGLDGRGQ